MYILSGVLKKYLENQVMKYDVNLRLTKDDLIGPDPDKTGIKYMKEFNKSQSVG
jgi:hypothetical protein